MKGTTFNNLFNGEGGDCRNPPVRSVETNYDVIKRLRKTVYQHINQKQRLRHRKAKSLQKYIHFNQWLSSPTDVNFVSTTVFVAVQANLEREVSAMEYTTHHCCCLPTAVGPSPMKHLAVLC